ncbi:MAG: TspO/MBR family protein [Sandaracinobacteroides sp.]
MLIPLLVSGAAAVVLALGGGLLTDIGPWYRELKKPRLQPPDWLFGPAWTLILGCWAYSAALAWVSAPDAETRLLVAGAFAINAVLHFIWSPLFFKLKRPDWSLIEIVPFWLSILVLIFLVAPLSERAAWLLVPYISWVSFAAGLNWRIVRLNGPFPAR